MFCFLATQNLQAGDCDSPVAQAVSIQGKVEVSSEAAPAWSPMKLNESLCPGNRVRVGANSRAGLVLHNDTLLRLDEYTSVTINAPAEDGSSWLDFIEGIAHFISRVKQSFRIQTPYVNASIEGTEFVVASDDEEARVSVIEGRVLAQNPQGEVLLGAGEQAVSAKDQPPRQSLMQNPRDAVKWALHYPLIFDPYQTEGGADGSLRQAQSRFGEGDISAALSALEAIDEEERDAESLLYHAALLLSVGRVDEADEKIGRALELSPDNAQALSLQSIIALTNNEQQAALALAEQAVAADNSSGAALIARSYAQQAGFDIDGALASAQQASDVAPEDALARVRLAELQLASGHFEQATDAANKAVELNPSLGLSHTMLGFSHLARFQISDARKAFEQALKLDQADPLPRLGLGLAKIRRGDLEQGRRDIEIAASLDPNNAIIRSYLGKAYFEERRDPLAATQLEMAKELDPRDPTPWYYDALRKQLANRPVEGLEDIQTSIDLNDNRAVYRSSFLLDQDEAARNASQARIYQDLGFDELALNEAYKSLQTNPETHSAHRLLSDSYAGRPRFADARLSELLVSQLLQPLNSTPIQPQLAVSNLGVLDGAGPSSGGHSEYTPLFTRNGFDIQFNAIGGSNSTAGNDLVLSGLHDRISYSLGQFHYETDGWRENNDLEQDIYNAFLQASLTPDTSIQFEYRQQDIERGDLALRFDPDDFSPIERIEEENSLGRIGVHHRFAPGTDLIASVIYQDLEEVLKENFSRPEIFDVPPFGPLPGTLESIRRIEDESTALTAELQLIHHMNDHTFIVGGGSHEEDNTLRSDSFQIGSGAIPVPPFFLSIVIADNSIPPFELDPEYKNLYLYSILQLPMGVDLTLGATYADFENAVFEIDEVDPKFGLTWEASDNVVVRAAYMESLAKPNNMERTLEPTQVAGFNQIFDEPQGSDIKQYGVGIDIKPTRSLSIGAEYNKRDLDAPFFVVGSFDDATLENREEDRYLVYLYWSPMHNLGLSLSYENEQFERDAFDPVLLDTQRLPIGISYFWNNGLYLKTVGTYIDQEIGQSGDREQEDFWNVDAVLGYRFPKQYGKAEIIVKNLLDEEFRYYDLSFNTGEPLLPQFQPEQQVFARVTINF